MVAHAILSVCSVPVLVQVQVWLCIPGDPQSVQLRNATTTVLMKLSVTIETHLACWHELHSAFYCSILVNFVQCHKTD